MPYVSEKQRAFAHTPTAKAKGFPTAEFDAASKGKSLPKKKKKARKKRKPMSSKMGGYTAA